MGFNSGFKGLTILKLKQVNLINWRRVEIIWTDHVRNEGVIQKSQGGEENPTDSTIGYILCRNCLLKFIVEGTIESRIEVTGRRWIKHKQLLDDLKGKRRYWKLKEDALGRPLWRTHFGRGYGPVVRQTAEWMSVMDKKVLRRWWRSLSRLMHARYLTRFRVWTADLMTQ